MTTAFSNSGALPPSSSLSASVSSRCVFSTANLLSTPSPRRIRGMSTEVVHSWNLGFPRSR